MTRTDEVKVMNGWFDQDLAGNPLQQWCPCRRTHQLSIVDSCLSQALGARRKEQGFVRRCQRSGRTGNRGYGAYAITSHKSQGRSSRSWSRRRRGSVSV